MNICYILVLSIFLQLSFGYLIKLLIPQLIGITWFTYTQMAILSIISVFLPSYLHLKNENSPYFEDCVKDVKLNGMIPLTVGIGICCQYAGMGVNLPVNYLIMLLGKKVTSNVPDVNSIFLFIIGIFVLCLMPAIFEEILFRKIIFNKGRQYGKKAAIILSALLFAMMHMDFSNFFGTLLLGTVCGIMVAKTNRIIYSMITHFTMNFVTLVISFISRNETFMNLYNDFYFVLILVAIPLLIYLLRLFSQNAESFDYKDKEIYEHVDEEIIKINDENSIRIISHDIRENNISLMMKKLFTSVYFYVILILFIYLGGDIFWK